MGIKMERSIWDQLQTDSDPEVSQVKKQKHGQKRKQLNEYTQTNQEKERENKRMHGCQV